MRELRISDSDTSDDPMETVASLLDGTSMALIPTHQKDGEESDCSRDEPVVVPSWYEGVGSPWLPSAQESNKDWCA